MSLIKKAVREKVKVKVLLMSPSGAGKTYSALRLAKGMGGKTLMIDTEARRGLYYADEFDYDYVELKELQRNDPDYNDYKALLPRMNDEPYAPENYIALIKYAVNNGYDNLIIDSTTHEWSSKGGILDAKNKMPGNNDYVKWAKLTPRHDNFIYEILHSPINVIATVRGKDAYVMEENSKGKQTPKKIGLGAVQRDGMEYEYTVTFLLDQESHVATVMKDNTHLFEGRYNVLTEQDGADLIKWANEGKINPNNSNIIHNSKSIEKSTSQPTQSNNNITNNSNTYKQNNNIQPNKKEEPNISNDNPEDLSTIISQIDALAHTKSVNNRDGVIQAIAKYHTSANYNSITDKKVAKQVLLELQNL